MSFATISFLQNMIKRQSQCGSTYHGINALFLVQWLISAHLHSHALVPPNNDKFLKHQEENYEEFQKHGSLNNIGQQQPN